MQSELDALKPFATPAQLKYIAMMQSGKSMRAVARELGINKNAVTDSMNRLRVLAARQGVAPAHDMTHAVPDPFVVKGVSTMYGPDGEVRAQWVKSKLGEVDPEKLIERMAERIAEIKRFEPVAPPETPHAPKLTNVVSIFDAHIGEKISAANPDERWDTEIASKTILGGVANLFGRLSNASRLVLVFGGDIMHYDGKLPVTPTSRHVLHSDGDMEAMADATIDVAVKAIDLALSCYPQVHLVWAEGNHDIYGSMWMRKLLAHIYADNPRLIVHQPKDRTAFFALNFGDNMIGIHHGHGVKPDDLPGAFANLFRKEWGQATRAYIHCGHQHHRYGREKCGAYVTQHPSLAPSDDYAKGKALVSERGCIGVTYHDTRGELDRLEFRPAMMDIFD